MRKLLTKCVIAILLICFASMTAFGCGGGAPSTPSNPSNPSTPSTPSEPSTPPSVSKEYEINFNVNGGDNQIAKMEVNTGDRVQLPTPTRGGYYFLGWYFNGTKQKDNGLWFHKQDVTLIAQWEKLFEMGDGVIENTTAYANANVSDFVIPSKMDGQDIVAIAPAAFLNATKLSSVRISSSVTEIMDEAFNGTTRLKSITFSSDSNLTTIGIKAFGGCTNLTSIVLPSSLTTIGESAFEGCTKLTSVKFKNGSNLEEIGASAFKNCTALSSISLPNTVTTVGASVFEGCSTHIKLEGNSVPSGFKTNWNGSCPFYAGVVLKDRISTEEQLVAVNLNEKVVVDLTKYGLTNTTVCHVERNGNTINNSFCSLDGDTLSIQVTGLKSGIIDFSIIVESEGKFYEIIVDYAKVLDFKIATIEQFKEFQTAIYSTPYGAKSFYAALTADIDGGIYVDGKLSAYTSVDTRNGESGGRFEGELDGQGHTISNLKVKKNAMFWEFGTTTIKNIAIYNIFGSNSTSDNSLLAWAGGTALLENVYLKGKMEQVNADDVAGLSNGAGGYTLINCIIDIEFPENAGDFGIIGKVGNITDASHDAYGISKTAKGLVLVEGGPAGVNTAMYKTTEDLKANISTSSLSSFSSKYWDTSSGVPVWKTLPKA